MRHLTLRLSILQERAIYKPMPMAERAGTSKDFGRRRGNPRVNIGCSGYARWADCHLPQISGLAQAFRRAHIAATTRPFDGDGSGGLGQARWRRVQRHGRFPHADVERLPSVWPRRYPACVKNQAEEKVASEDLLWANTKVEQPKSAAELIVLNRPVEKDLGRSRRTETAERPSKSNRRLAMASVGCCMRSSAKEE